MHKTRENSNGTFSIGKTWGIDLLERLEETDALGFIITVQKPYYWMAETSKDKYAFVTALIQVYRKFTGGKSPEIVGFDSIFRPSGSLSTRQQSPPVNPYTIPPPQSNPFANAPPPPNPYVASPPPSQQNPYTSASPPPLQQNPYVTTSPPPLQPNPYTATSPPPLQSNPYTASPPPSQSNPYITPSSNPYANAAPADPYATAAVAPLKPQRLPSETSERRPYPAERRPSRDSSKSSPDRPRSRDKPSRDVMNGAPPIPTAPLTISRQASASPSIRSTSDTLTAGYDNSSIRSRRQQDEDTVSVNSIGSRSGRTGGPRPMMSTPALRSSPIPAQRALADSPLPNRPESAGRSSPPTPPPSKAAVPSKHAPKLSISISTSLPSKLQNGGVVPAPETPATATKMNSPVRKRPRSVEDTPPSEETLSAAMLEIEYLLSSFDWTHPTLCATRLETLLTDELEAVESDNVHALVMNDGAQMQEFMSRMDDGIKQCEELDEMLTLYLVELQALADDINLIESENRGLHVRTANERALEKELSELLNTMSINPREFEILRQESLDKNEGIDRVEKSLLQIYRALKACSGLVDQQDDDGPKENMQIVREMRRMTHQESEKFLARLREFVKIKFQATFLAIYISDYRRNSCRYHLRNRNQRRFFLTIQLHILISIVMLALFYLPKKSIVSPIWTFDNFIYLLQINLIKKISEPSSHNGNQWVEKPRTMNSN
jgi:exocyst complex component 1